MVGTTATYLPQGQTRTATATEGLVVALEPITHR